MKLELDRNSGIPVYAQIVAWVEKQIEEGIFCEGERLPAERSICERFKVARNTVKRAYEELNRRGLIITEPGSGSFVRIRELKPERKYAKEQIRQMVLSLKQEGLTRLELEHMFLELVWKKLPEAEKLSIVWVDCSAEILQDTAREIEKTCNVRVTPLLLDHVRNDPFLLFTKKYDMAATTINHFDELNRMTEGRMIPIEMVVLTVSPMSVSQIARIEPEMQVIAVYEQEWYRYSIECYLKEFDVKAKISYVKLKEVMDCLRQDKVKQVVILPQDFFYGDGKVEEIYQYCVRHSISCFAFQQMIDNGSLMQMKKRIQSFWKKRGIEKIEKTLRI